MGDWDLYCALCATNTSGVHADNIGSTNPAMLAIRRSVILELKKQVESGEVAFPSPTFEDEAEDLDEAEIAWDWDDESCAYDPALVSEKSTEWQGDVCCLGLNAETGRYVRRPRACWWPVAKVASVGVTSLALPAMRTM